MSPRYDSLRKVQPKEVLKFIRLHQHNPRQPGDWSYREIGQHFGISGQRVYQIEHGKR
jgi:DNA-directed RNA polymerase sigma subunit (sigma70/sigma32)